MGETPSILYENSGGTIFLVDIPASIESAQKPSAQCSSRGTNANQRRPRHKATKTHILSSRPLGTPYPGSSEPKTKAAREKVLGRIPASELEFYAEVQPLIVNALNHIRENRQPGDSWCTLRSVFEYGCPDPEHSGKPDKPQRGKKRMRESVPKLLSNEFQFLTGDSKVDQEAQRQDASSDPPLILSPGVNRFDSMSEISNTLARNTSFQEAVIQVRCHCDVEEESSVSIVSEDELSQNGQQHHHYHTFYVPPSSNLLLRKLPITPSCTNVQQSPPMQPIPGLPRDQKFNLILFDPPWSNRSVRRSGHYHTQCYLDDDSLSRKISDILKIHSTDTTIWAPNSSIAAIWVTNSAKSKKIACNALHEAGFMVCEEWIWIKTTTKGEPVTPLEGLWRKPYEVLVIGKRACNQWKTRGPNQIFQRVIAAVPDVHSRKPHLRDLFEKVFFSPEDVPNPFNRGRTYSALEVFARNLTAGWWACGDEVLLFNSEEWWI
ncbi:hypothetical protein AOCH_002377 [Aspergillus ochraceoroseus]|uniref:MT-A70 family n=1 Tax=Aspergillus ochraceoroseus TaxID=138278 RepID=A0A0F8UXC8_9EURO|nr:hypothetical protein AOCH_002377 [Aspergillus ochraceoroseus]